MPARRALEDSSERFASTRSSLKICKKWMGIEADRAKLSKTKSSESLGRVAKADASMSTAGEGITRMQGHIERKVQVRYAARAVEKQGE
eukprot:scaffold89477_cov27-Tisochrysis_lutea.AAC.7